MLAGVASVGVAVIFAVDVDGDSGGVAVDAGVGVGAAAAASSEEAGAGWGAPPFDKAPPSCVLGRFFPLVLPSSGAVPYLMPTSLS